MEEQVRETEEDGRISVNSNLELVQALRQQTTTSERCEIHVVLFSLHGFRVAAACERVSFLCIKFSSLLICYSPIVGLLECVELLLY